MNLGTEDLSGGVLRDRVKVGASLADVDPMNLDSSVSRDRRREHRGVRKSQTEAKWLTMTVTWVWVAKPSHSRHSVGTVLVELFGNMFRVSTGL